MLCHHFKRGTDPKRGDIYANARRERNEKVFDAADDADVMFADLDRRINVDGICRRSLTDDDVLLLKEWLHSFLVSIKHQQLYPEGSFVSQGSLEKLNEVMYRMWDRMDGIVIKIDPDKIIINSRRFVSEGKEDCIADLIKLLKKNYLIGLTLLAGMQEWEMEKLIKTLAFPMPEISLNPKYWEEFLEENKFTGVDIIQQFYMASSDALDSQIIKLPWDHEVLTVMKDILRYFVATVENLRRYPETSHLVTVSAEALLSKFRQILEKMEDVTFSEVRDAFVINGTAIDPRILGHQAKTLSRVMKTHGVKSSSFLRAINYEELIVFLKIMSDSLPENLKPKEFWEQVEIQQKMPHIVINGRIFKEVQIEETPDEELEEYVKKDWKDMTLEEKISHLLQIDPSRYMEEEISGYLAEVMLELIQQDRKDYVVITDKISMNLEHESEEVRFTAAESLENMVQNMQNAMFMKTIIFIIKKAMEQEKSRKVFEKLLDTSLNIILHLYSKNQMEETEELLKIINRRNTENSF